MSKVIGTFEHPKFGFYYIHWDDNCYNLSRDEKPIHCAYASLAVLFKAKGF